jgi:hypothetical protein
MMEIEMASEKSFSLATQKRPIHTPADAKTARRARLIARIQRQLELLEIVKRGEPLRADQRRTQKWWWQDGPNYFVSIYYTKQPLEIAKGKWSAQCTNLDGVGDALKAFQKSVENGEFDHPIELLADKVRAKFKKST